MLDWVICSNLNTNIIFSYICVWPSHIYICNVIYISLKIEFTINVLKKMLVYQYICMCVC